MKAYFVLKPFSGELRDIEIPSPGPDEVLIKVDSAGICGTDVHIFKGERKIKLPMILGHEFSGIVSKVGSNVEDLKVGEKVTVNPNINCGKCYRCRIGQPHYCENWRAVGIHIPGGFAEYVVAPAKNVYKLPENMDLEKAAFSEPLACCLHGQDKLNIEHGDEVLIIGSGPIGLIHLQLTRLRGASTIIVSDLFDWKLNIAKELGADYVINPSKEHLSERVLDITGGRGVDKVIEASGSIKAFEEGLSCLGNEGAMLVFGVAPEDEWARISPFKIYKKELRIVGSFVNPFTTERAIKLLASGRITVDRLITHRIKLENMLEYMLKLAHKKIDSLKILVKP